VEEKIFGRGANLGDRKPILGSDGFSPAVRDVISHQVLGSCRRAFGRPGCGHNGLPSAMSARRQASTTSLSKYARDGSPDPSARHLDFCNAFWGPNDAGVDVLFARMRGAARTMEELRNFWKERYLAFSLLSSRLIHFFFRTAIEEDYAKRLAKLAKTTMGRDEIGCVLASTFRGFH
jgi:hypothetical protein